MIPFELFSQIKSLYEQQGLKPAQIARELGLDPRTVQKWLKEKQFRPRNSSAQRASKLDPFKDSIFRMLEAHPYTAVQVLQRIREEGYEGSYTLVKSYVRKVRPRRPRAFLKLSFAPGECAQVDWGSYRSIRVGQTGRMNPTHPVRKIVALSEIYSTALVARAMEDAFSFQAFSCEYIANLLEQRSKKLPEPGALHLTRREDLLDIEVEPPDLSIYLKDR